ncbi:acylphosphatase [Spongiibacter tropicus]|uniref:acylphosphatase n=1 Tax=Spongiibacter tropicus TaxID=454602 RepID=UPI003A99F8B7
MKCVQLRITGKVQGVWYRRWTVGQAKALGLNGWVRNRQDGSVEALVYGPADQVDALIAACHDGSPKARVESVTATSAEPEPVTGFQQRPTL